MSYCPSCGHEQVDRDRYCRNCGEDVDDVTVGTETAGQQGPSEGAHRGESAFSFAFRYPFENGLGPVLKGSVAVFASVFLFGLFLVAAPVEQDASVVLVYTFLSLPVSLLPLCVFVGYLSRLGGAAARGEPDPPTFEGVGSLIREGFGLALTYGLYYVVWFVLWILPAMAIVTVTANRTLTMVYGLFIYFLVIYLLPAVLTVYAVTGSIRSAFSLSRLRGFAATGTYLKGWLVYLLLSIVLSILFSVSAFTVVGLFLTTAVTGVIVASYWGRVYDQTTGPSPGPAS